VAAQDGTLWMATEYVSPQRTFLINWSTFPYRVTP
jgi:hypothetical protein